MSTQDTDGVERGAREAFESWLTNEFPNNSNDWLRIDDDDDYLSFKTVIAWAAWQAARTNAIRRAGKVEGWISVEDRLPEPEVDVLVHIEGRVPMVAGVFHGEWESFDSTPIYSNPTHWMPLPALPRPAERNEP